MIPPRPPAGVIARPPLRGELARWHHADRLPFLEVALYAGAGPDRPPAVTVATGPARNPLAGITDPAELRRAAWLLLGSARALERERRRAGLPDHEPEPDPQMTVFDYPEASQ